ncbi:MAG: protein-tyrosine phosphatase [Phycisphaerales bacterium]|jgi:protein-tyrosine phosphatase
MTTNPRPISRSSEPTRVLMVCLGNICRSPLAEGLLIHLAERRGVSDLVSVDSCGTGGWHAGDAPDPRSLSVALKHGVNLPSRARQFDPGTDIEGFDLLIAMDRSNQATLIERGTPAEKVRMMLDFHPELAGEDVPDPYYGGPNGFDDVYEMVKIACDGVLDQLINR